MDLKTTKFAALRSCGAYTVDLYLWQKTKTLVASYLLASTAKTVIHTKTVLEANLGHTKTYRHTNPTVTSKKQHLQYQGHVGLILQPWRT